MFRSKNQPAQPSPQPGLSRLEQQVMDCIWRHGGISAEACREQLLPQRVLKDSSIRTILRRLEEKGYCRHRLEGRTYIYEARQARPAVAAAAARQVLERFCGGSVEQLLLGLVEHEGLDPAELERLAQRIRQRAAERHDPPAPEGGARS